MSAILGYLRPEYSDNPDIQERYTITAEIDSFFNNKRLLVNFPQASSKNIRLFYRQKTNRKEEKKAIHRDAGIANTSVIAFTHEIKEENRTISISFLYIQVILQLRKYSKLLLSREEMQNSYLQLKLRLSLNQLEPVHL